MANLKINTDAVVSTAKRISSYNKQINDGFSSVQNAIKQLDRVWDGSAATASMGKFNELKSNYVNSRYHAMDNFVKFLYIQVGEGYTQTEEVNVSLADKFK